MSTKFASQLSYAAIIADKRKKGRWHCYSLPEVTTRTNLFVCLTRTTATSTVDALNYLSLWKKKKRSIDVVKYMAGNNVYKKENIWTIKNKRWLDRKCAFLKHFFATINSNAKLQENRSSWLRMNFKKQTTTTIYWCTTTMSWLAVTLSRHYNIIKIIR